MAVGRRRQFRRRRWRHFAAAPCPNARTCSRLRHRSLSGLRCTGPCRHCAMGVRALLTHICARGRAIPRWRDYLWDTAVHRISSCWGTSTRLWHLRPFPLPLRRACPTHNSTGAPNYSACLSPSYLTAMLHRPIGQFLPGQNPMDSVFECGPFRSIPSFHARGHAFRSFAVLSGHSRAAPQCALHLPLPQKLPRKEICVLCCQRCGRGEIPPIVGQTFPSHIPFCW